MARCWCPSACWREHEARVTIILPLYNVVDIATERPTKRVSARADYYLIKMLCLRKPSEQAVREYILDRQNQPLSYEHVNMTTQHTTKEDFETDPALQSFDVDRHRFKIGTGEECFRKAVGALKQWKHLELEWVTLCFPDTPIEVGSTIAHLSFQMGFWVISFCRIVHVIDEWSEDGRVTRFGFAYGTLKEHLEKGEEQFMVEWNHEDDSVYYDILAISKPQHLLAQVGYPIARYFQVRKSVLSACLNIHRGALQQIQPSP